MITVNFAINEGRDIFSVPGNIDSSYSEGCNSLIKAGACIATSFIDVLEGLNLIEEQENCRDCRLAEWFGQGRAWLQT